MDIMNSVNPSQSEPARLELQTRTETAILDIDPPPPYSSAIAVTTQPTNTQTPVVQPQFKKNPSFHNCPNCEKRVLTHVEYLNSRKTHLVAGFICGSTVWCLLCCFGIIPYVMNSCKKAHHYCPHCNTFLGAYSML